MKTSIFKIISTRLVVVALFFSFVFSPVSASAQVVDITTQLNNLTAALVAIGDSIAGATNLTEEQRFNLFTQLVGVSSQIMALRGSNTASQVDPEAVEAAKDTALEAGLTRVFVTYLPATNQAVTDVTMNSQTTRMTYTLPELASAPLFTDKIGRLREIVAMRVSDAENVKYRDVYAALFVTSRDPARANPIAVNSNVANYLANNFSKHSILTRIQILPGDGRSVIRIFTDQDDFLQLTLGREPDYDGYINRSSDFFYMREYFTDDLINPSVVYDTSAEGTVPAPRAFDSESGIPDENIEVFMTTLLNDIPFTTRISNFGLRLKRFLVENPTTLRDSFSTPEDRRDCYSSGDKVVVDEFIEYIVNGLEAQYEDISSITEYVAPLSSSDDGFGCSSRVRFF